MEVAFIHPDLGLGGAEQLVVNLALSIRPGFKPTIFTPRFTRSFQPCHDGTLQVEQHGHFLPRSVFGRFSALMVYLRTIYCALWVAFFGPLFEAFVVDQVSAVVPLLKLCGRRVIFYCHFPDKALSGPRAGWARKCYRLCIDLWEELSLLCADQILVNS